MAAEKSMESAEGYKSPAGMAERWGKEIEAAEKELKEFHEASRQVVRQYLDKRDAFENEQSKINVFWSNTQVLKATLYAKPPKVDVSRTHRDEDDDVARVAGTMLERMLNNDVEKDGSPFDKAARQGIEDWLIVALGQMWVRYEVETEKAQTEPVTDPVSGAVLVPPQEYEAIVREDAVTDYVFWGDFLWSPARTWQEVRWVARKVYMTRDALKKRFGEKIGAAIPLATKKVENGPQNQAWQTACVYEVWCKDSRTVYWYVKGFETIVDYKPDPLGLSDFFPCPEPLAGNLTTSNFMPRADFTMAQDLYKQINEAQTRLKYLVKACKVAGAYDKNTPELGRLLADGGENRLVPVDNWALLGEKGGLKGVTDFVPIEQVVKVIAGLREDIAAGKGELYEVLGIADIMRGASDAGETATAQQIKAQYGSTRLQFKQFEVARWVRDCLRLKAEIICLHFQPQTIVERSGIARSSDAPLAEQAVELLKQEGTLGYRVTVEADSMAAMDWASERDARATFMDAIGRYVTAMTPLLESQPQAAPLMLKLLQWGLGGFRVGKQIESVLDQAIKQVEQSLAMPQPPQPSPKEEAEVRKINAQADRDQAQAVKTVVETRAAAAMGGMAASLPPAAPANQSVVPGGMQ